MGGNIGTCTGRRASVSSGEPVLRATSLDLIYSDNYFNEKKGRRTNATPENPKRRKDGAKGGPGTHTTRVRIKSFSDTNIRRRSKRNVAGRNRGPLPRIVEAPTTQRPAKKAAIVQPQPNWVLVSKKPRSPSLPPVAPKKINKHPTQAKAAQPIFPTTSRPPTATRTPSPGTGSRPVSRGDSNNTERQNTRGNTFSRSTESSRQRIMSPLPPQKSRPRGAGKGISPSAPMLHTSIRSRSAVRPATARTSTPPPPPQTTRLSRPRSRIPVMTRPPPPPEVKGQKRRLTCDDCFPKDKRSRSRSSSNPKRKSKPKKKLIIKGLRRFCDSHKRHPSEPASCPSLWRSEFPDKSKFHPDNYIYEWGEGPKAPPRPLSAMARCRKHGGRCDNCGVFSRDICQSCRRCELDCACYRNNENRRMMRGVNTVAAPHQQFPFPMEAYKEVFSGDGWSKTCKVLCDLTENEKLNPVGGRGNIPIPKRTSSSSANNGMNRRRSELNSKFYQSSIDVLNPYNIPMSGEAEVLSEEGGAMMIPPQYQGPPMMMPYYSMPPMMPSMYTMPCMPVMPSLPPPPPPSVMPYFDPLYGGGASPLMAPSPYPISEAFLPMQNF